MNLMNKSSVSSAGGTKLAAAFNSHNGIGIGLPQSGEHLLSQPNNGGHYNTQGQFIRSSTNMGRILGSSGLAINDDVYTPTNRGEGDATHKSASLHMRS